MLSIGTRFQEKEEVIHLVMFYEFALEQDAICRSVAAGYEGTELHIFGHLLLWQSTALALSNERRCTEMVDKAAAHDGGGGSGGLISPKAPQIFSKAVQFFWKVNHDTQEKFIFA